MNSAHWMIRRYTGAHITLSDEELKTITKRSNELAGGRFWIMLLLGTVGISVAVVVLSPYPRAWLKTMGMGKITGALLGSLGTGLVLLIVFLWICTRFYIKPMRKALNEMGHPICLRCGYWLKELDESIAKCPECGGKREIAPPSSETVESDA